MHQQSIQDLSSLKAMKKRSSLQLFVSNPLFLSPGPAMPSGTCFWRFSPPAHLSQVSGSLSGLLTSESLQSAVLEQGHIPNMKVRMFTAQCLMRYKMMQHETAPPRAQSQHQGQVLISLSYLQAERAAGVTLSLRWSQQPHVKTSLKLCCEKIAEFSEFWELVYFIYTNVFYTKIECSLYEKFLIRNTI